MKKNGRIFAGQGPKKSQRGPYPVPSELGPESSGFAGHSQRCAAVGWGQCTQLLPVGWERSVWALAQLPTLTFPKRSPRLTVSLQREAAQGVMGTTPDPRASLAVRAPPVLASVQGQGSEAAAVRVRKEEWARGKHKEGKVQVAARRPQLQAPCGSGPKIKSGQFFSEGRRIIFIPWCGGRLPLGSKIEVNRSI